MRRREEGRFLVGEEKAFKEIGIFMCEIIEAACWWWCSLCSKATGWESWKFSTWIPTRHQKSESTKLSWWRCSESRSWRKVPKCCWCVTINHKSLFCTIDTRTRRGNRKLITAWMKRGRGKVMGKFTERSRFLLNFTQNTILHSRWRPRHGSRRLKISPRPRILRYNSSKIYYFRSRAEKILCCRWNLRHCHMISRTLIASPRPGVVCVNENIQWEFSFSLHHWGREKA